MFDIHSHILPAIDDGAENLNEALKLLREMKKQGITDVLATPHFYPYEDSLDEFLTKAKEKFKLIRKHIDNDKYPNIFLGCEMPYFKGIANADRLEELCLNETNYLLLEICYNDINKSLFEDISNLLNERNIIPIIAHVERYSEDKNFKKLLRFLKHNKILTQINASSFFIEEYKSTLKTLIKKDIAFVIATDTHSVKCRPPELKMALEYIKQSFGEECYKRFLDNSQFLYERICCKND